MSDTLYVAGRNRYCTAGKDMSTCRSNSTTCRSRQIRTEALYPIVRPEFIEQWAFPSLRFLSL